MLGRCGRGHGGVGAVSGSVCVWLLQVCGCGQWKCVGVVGGGVGVVNVCVGECVWSV